MGRDIARESYLCERRLGMRQVNAGQACLCNTSQGALPIRMEKTVFPVGNQMEQAFPLEMFRKKGIPSEVFLFSRFHRNYRKITVPFTLSH